MVRNFFYFIIAALLFSCKPDDVTPPPTPVETARIVVNPSFGSLPLMLDSIYQGPNGIQIKVYDIKFYTTLLSNQNNTFAEVGYFDFREKDALRKFALAKYFVSFWLWHKLLARYRNR